MRNKIKIEWSECIQDRKNILDQLATSHPSAADLIFEEGANGTEHQ